MKQFEIGHDLSLLALDAAHEIDTVAAGSCVLSVRDLAQRLDNLSARLATPFSDVEASVSMGNVFKAKGFKVDTVEDLRKCLNDIATALNGDVGSLISHKVQLVSFCIAIANLPVPKRNSALAAN